MDSLATFYFDRCLGKRFPEALAKASPPFKVEWQHKPKSGLRQDMPDDKWLEMCGQLKWVAFSHDRKFHAIEVEAAAIRQHHVAAFTLCGADEPTWAKLGYFVKAYAKIAAVVVGEKPPYLYRLHKTLMLERVRLP